MVLQVSDRVETHVREYMAREGFENVDAAIESLLDDYEASLAPAGSTPASIKLPVEAFDKLGELLSKPPPHSDALERAKQRHKELISRSER